MSPKHTFVSLNIAITMSRHIRKGSQVRGCDFNLGIGFVLLSCFKTSSLPSQ